MTAHETAHPTRHAKVPVRVENTTDATRGEPIVSRARTRKAELEKAHDLLPSTKLRALGDIELALARRTRG